MTATLNVTCDKCGRTIEADRHLVRVDSGSLRGRRPEVDLCTGCAAVFLDWLGQADDASGAAPTFRRSAPLTPGT